VNTRSYAILHVQWTGNRFGCWLQCNPQRGYSMRQQSAEKDLSAKPEKHLKEITDRASR